MRLVADCSDGGEVAVQQTLRTMLFMSALIKWFKGTEVNGRSQAIEVEH